MAEILPWADYVTYVHHKQLGDYGGDCKMIVGISCQPCRDEGKSFLVASFSSVLPDNMIEVLAQITEHERTAHGRVWREIG